LWRMCDGDRGGERERFLGRKREGERGGESEESGKVKARESVCEGGRKRESEQKRERTSLPERVSGIGERETECACE
jgi:hypothetical protein